MGEAGGQTSPVSGVQGGALKKGAAMTYLREMVRLLLCILLAVLWGLNLMIWTP